jgi:hypothetical protein
MARQTGLIKIKGTLDNVNFYKTKDGDLARMKTSVDAERIRRDPAFERTRENNAEFANSAKAGKLLRDSVRPLAMTAADFRVTSRMTRLMSQIKNLDGTSSRGERSVANGIQTTGALDILKGFEFNKNAMLSAILFKPYALDTNTGVFTLNGLVPQVDIVWPQGATHVAFTGAVTSVNFETGAEEMVSTNTITLPINMTSTNIVLTPSSVPTVGNVQLFLIRIEFFQEVNGNLYTLKNNAYNALRIVDAI